MKVIFVGAGPGDPELLTVRAARLLAEAACCIYAGSLVSPEVVALLPATCRAHDSAGMDLDAILAVIEAERARDVDVIRLHTGDPSLYGAINEQIRALEARGIPYEVVPGVSSFQAAAAALGVELTAPEIAQTVILTRTPGRTPMPEAQTPLALAPSRATQCVFLSTHKVGKLCAELTPHYGADCPAALVYHASWPDQRILRGTLATLPALVAEDGARKTAMILLGHALARIGAESKLYDACFGHEYRDARPAARPDDSGPHDAGPDDAGNRRPRTGREGAP